MGTGQRVSEQVGFTGMDLTGPPVHRQEQGAGPDARRDLNPRGHTAATGVDPGHPAIGQPVGHRVVGMDLQKGLRMLGRESGHPTGAGHGVPVAQVSADREHERKALTGWLRQTQGDIA